MGKKIFENKEYVIYAYGHAHRHGGCLTYRVHFFEDEKIRDVMKKKSFITKNYQKIKKYLGE